MGHDERGAAGDHGVKSLLHQHLSTGIDGAGGLVQQKYRGIGKHHAGDAEQLALALR